MELFKNASLPTCKSKHPLTRACWQIVALQHHSKAVSDQWTFLWSQKLWWRKSVTTKSSKFSVLLCMKLEGLAEDTCPGIIEEGWGEECKSEAHRAHWVGRNSQGSSNPFPGTTEDDPRVPPCAWECCPNSSWALSVWCCDHFPGQPVPILTLTPLTNIQAIASLQICAAPLGPVMGLQREDNGAAPPLALMKKLQTELSSPLSFLSRLNEPSDLTHCSYGFLSKPSSLRPAAALFSCMRTQIIISPVHNVIFGVFLKIFF